MGCIATNWALLSTEIQQDVFSRETAHFNPNVNMVLDAQSWH